MILPPGHDEAMAELMLEPPPRLFKYMSLRHVDSLLAHRELHFQSPASFNDPFDCSPRIVIPKTQAAIQLRLRQDRERVRGGGNEADADAMLKQLAKLPPEKLKIAALENWHQLVWGYGITCFSEIPNHPLLWGHYADSHRGVCIEFESSHLPRGPDHLLIKVFYREERSQFHFPRGNIFDRKIDVLRVLNTKGRHWEYEREWRVVKMNGAESASLLPFLTVRRVIFGARCPDSEISRIESLLGEGFPAASTSLARLNLDGFGISTD